jgi:hypothetical protein
LSILRAEVQAEVQADLLGGVEEVEQVLEPNILEELDLRVEVVDLEIHLVRVISSVLAVVV